MASLATAQTLPAQLPSGAEPGRETPRPVMPQSSTASQAQHLAAAAFAKALVEADLLLDHRADVSALVDRLGGGKA